MSTSYCTAISYSYNWNRFIVLVQVFSMILSAMHHRQLHIKLHINHSLQRIEWDRTTNIISNVMVMTHKQGASRKCYQNLLGRWLTKENADTGLQGSHNQNSALCTQTICMERNMHLKENQPHMNQRTWEMRGEGREHSAYLCLFLTADLATYMANKIQVRT